MTSGGRRKSMAAFVVLGVCVAGVATALNVGWIIVSWENVGLLIIGLVVFPLVVTGVVLNTIFLVREIRRNEQQQAFINAVTHELKTPVASMRLYLQTLQNRDVDEKTRREFYGAMIEDNDRLLGTIEQVLRAGELSARHQKTAHHVAVDLGAVVARCLQLAETRHHLAPGALTFRQAPNTQGGNGLGAYVLGDEDELRVVVSNLLDNAIRYSGAGVRVAVELEQTDHAMLTLRVRDNGIGIPVAEQKRIFKRFYRISGTESTRVKGTGLGLFLVKAVVRRHGGKVYAESDGAGRGSTFVVQLPLATAP
jgi:two-component system sensor histidine kinase SenX3